MGALIFINSLIYKYIQNLITLLGRFRNFRRWNIVGGGSLEACSGALEVYLVPFLAVSGGYCPLWGKHLCSASGSSSRFLLPGPRKSQVTMNQNLRNQMRHKHSSECLLSFYQIENHLIDWGNIFDLVCKGTNPARSPHHYGLTEALLPPKASSQMPPNRSGHTLSTLPLHLHSPYPAAFPGYWFLLQNTEGSRESALKFFCMIQMNHWFTRHKFSTLVCS